MTQIIVLDLSDSASVDAFPNISWTKGNFRTCIDNRNTLPVLELFSPRPPHLRARRPTLRNV
jgi:hypothetical protein